MAMALSHPKKTACRPAVFLPREDDRFFRSKMRRFLPGGIEASISKKPKRGGILMAGWWLGHPSEKYGFVSWDDNRNPV